MSGLAGVTVGEEVVIHDANFGARRQNVTAVARKYATIGGSKYDIETGQIADRWGHAHAYTVAAWERREAERVLRETMLKVSERRTFDGLSDEAIREITAMLEGVRQRLEGT